MNNLSTIIYLADVLPRFAQTSRFAVVAFLLGFIAYHFIRFLNWTEDKDGRGNHIYPKPTWNPWLPAFAVGFGLLCAFVPSKDTMYLLAASELGEQVITHPDTIELYDDVRTALKKMVNAE